jgi:uncharacterized protein
MIGPFVGFDWDDGNREKCRKHGVSQGEVETLFLGSLMAVPDVAHSRLEERFLAIGRSGRGRHVFVAFTIRHKDDGPYIRPISARYMHRREIESYEKENPEI